jgi:AbiV family abortive infection protein
MARKLDSYKGQLNPAQISDGMNSAHRNAIRLLTDAKILLDADRYPSAAALSILSIEESGKSSILRLLALSKTNEDRINAWKEYRSHVKKNVQGILPSKFIEGAQKLDDFLTLFDGESEYPYLLEQIKQVSLYTDCLGQAHWSEPAQVIDKELAAS